MRSLETTLQYIIPPAMLVIAQAVPLPDGANSIYMEAFRSLGVLAVLAWYLWYTTSISNPKLLDAAAKERASTAEANRLEQDQKRKDFIEAMAAQRHEFQESLSATTDTFKTAIEKINCKFEREREKSA